LGGIEAGFNWDFKSLVAGIEGDVSLGDIQGKTTVSCLPFCFGATPTSFSFSTDYESLATLRARVGASWNRVLFFATGGLATAKVTDQLTPPNSGAGRASYSQSGYLVGGTAGVGAEVALNRNWSLKGEYLFTWLPTRTLSVPGAYGMSPTDADTQTFTHTFNVVRFALNYRFK
jgi:outer membrane immunogenic protein